MRIIFFAIAIFCFTNFGFAQTNSLVGAWYWSDSTKQISIFIKANGSISMHSGEKGGVILEKNLKVGQYDYKKNVLVITWPDSTIEKCKVSFIDRDQIVVEYFDSKGMKTKRKLTFYRIVDQEG
jgi:hypothetical protein